MDGQTANDVSKATISVLLSYSSRTAAHRQTKTFQEILPKFSSPLKTNFENRNLWLRFGLTLSLSKESPQSALQAFIECMRIDQNDPLPAMLAAKLLLEDLDDPEKGLDLAREAIDRCKRLSSAPSSLITSFSSSSSSSPPSSSSSSSTSSQLSLSQSQSRSAFSKLLSPESSCHYRNIAPLLSKCYLLASVMHAHIYELKPESIRKFETLTLRKTNLEDSQQFLDLAMETHKDYLVYFHKALHEARQRSYPAAIDNLRQAIKLNPHHLPSMQLLILSLSALELLDDALLLCETTLQEYEDNLLLLYIKCNLEQRLVETKGYKSALSTAQHMLKCIRRSTTQDSSKATSTSTATTMPNSINTATPAPVPLLTVNTPVLAETKLGTNLFAEDISDGVERAEFISGELSVWLLVAEIFVKIGSIEDAEMCVDEGSIHANGALSHKIMFIRGLIAKAKSNLIEAKTFFQSCLALCPRHARALQQIAHVHYLLGNYSTAEKFLRDSLDVDGNCSKSWDYLRLVHIEQNQYDRAKKCEQEFEALEESSPVIPISAISRLTLE